MFFVHGKWLLILLHVDVYSAWQLKYFVSPQQSYGQQNYGSYAQPAAADSSYTQTTPAAGGYPQQQQQYGSSYGQPASGRLIKLGHLTLIWCGLCCTEQ